MKGYDFDDILLVPTKISEVISREDVDISVHFKGFSLDFPIIVSPMKGIINYELMSVLSDLGGIGIYHRFDSIGNILKIGQQAVYDGIKFGLSCSLGDPTYKQLLSFEPEILCIDVANGYLKSLHSFIEDVATYILSQGIKTLIMSGNVVEEAGTQALLNCGVDIIRCGIGGGSLCTTRNVTGVGMPQLTAIDRCSEILGGDNYLVSDGGIRNSGDIVKALTFGADCVLIGGMFGRAKESANNGIIYGMASRQLQEEYYHAVKSVEGMSMEMEKDFTAEEIISELCYGIKSACTYLGCRNIQDLWSLNLKECVVEVGRGSIKEL